MIILPDITRQNDLWNIKPPDFTPKLYRSQSLPRIKKRTLNLHKLSDISHDVGKMRPVRISEPEQMTVPPFNTSYRPPDLLQLKLLFVKSGQFPRDLYANPKAHNFRPGCEKMPEMVTCIEKDPGNLRFKLLSLGAIREDQAVPSILQRDTARKMNTFKPAELKWDTKLILPKSPWPPKSASYTRHRRRRGVHSAFMDRVEEKLTKSWIK
ncbi:putative uncharacterized protein C7orf78 [Hoplias malabaricus]|uniref:putative uncharacterized protein C7orf78 n=1 Tax=Hoplias malabaricus TaxID=27720 RepID=UPI0034622322